MTGGAGQEGNRAGGGSSGNGAEGVAGEAVVGAVDNLRGIVDKNRFKSINFVCIVAEAAMCDLC